MQLAVSRPAVTGGLWLAEASRMIRATVIAIAADQCMPTEILFTAPV